MLVNSAIEMIGDTPLLKADRFAKALALPANLLVKVEGKNPAGSAKDRAALYIIKDAEEKGILKPGSLIIEPTSGNTGIGLASIAAVKGYKCALIMPDTASQERVSILKAYGAEVYLTPGKEGMSGCISKAEQLEKENPGSFIAGQFVNQANALAHYETTGPEIERDTEGNVDFFVAGVGTGGTITGTGKYLKEKHPEVKIIAVEPATSPLLTKGYSGPHALQGIGANFIPDVLDQSILDEVLPIENEDAFTMGKLFAKTEGILIGITGGAALQAGVILARREENKGKNIVVFLPDGGDRYYSTPLFQD